MFGGDGRDELAGGQGNDLLEGEAGNDQLYGQAGDDSLDGGSGRNLTSGGLGDDTYLVSNLESRNDTITDTGGNDTLDLSNWSGTSGARFSTSDLTVQTITQGDSPAEVKLRLTERQSIDHIIGIGNDDDFTTGMASHTWTVSTLQDESDGDYSIGDLSLREALLLARQTPSDPLLFKTIKFDESLFVGLEQPATIQLAYDGNDDGVADRLSIKTSVHITGPGAHQLVIRGVDDNQIFYAGGIDVHDGGSTKVEISGLTLTGAGQAAVKTVGGKVKLHKVRIIDNHGSGIVSNHTNLHVFDSEILSNDSENSGAGIRYVANQSGEYMFELVHSKIAGNIADTNGGGVFVNTHSADSVTLNWVGARVLTNQAIDGSGLFLRDNDGVSNLQFDDVSLQANNGGPDVGGTADAVTAIEATGSVGDPELRDLFPSESVVVNLSDRLTTSNWDGHSSGGASQFQFASFSANASNSVIQSWTREGFAFDNIDALSRPDRLQFINVRFNQPVTIAEDALRIINDSDGGSQIPLEGVDFYYNLQTNDATWVFSDVELLEPGYYTLSLNYQKVVPDGSIDPVPFDASFHQQIYVAIPGDVNLDGQVNVLGDAFTYVQNEGTTSGATWSDGDVDGDGDVDVIGDGFIIVGNLNLALPDLDPPMTTGVAATLAEIAPLTVDFGNSVSVATLVTDTDLAGNDTHLVAIDWGNGNIELGVMAGDLAGGAHSYDAGGDYSGTLKVVDSFGNASSTNFSVSVLGDSDNDGLSDADEAVLGTDPNDHDSDGDKLDDGFEEESSSLDPLTPSDPNADSDGDGLSDLGEQVHETDPDVVDTDADGLSDFDEVEMGTDPNNPDSDGDGIIDGDESQQEEPQDRIGFEVAYRLGAVYQHIDPLPEEFFAPNGFNRYLGFTSSELAFVGATRLLNMGLGPFPSNTPPTYVSVSTDSSVPITIKTNAHSVRICEEWLIGGENGPSGGLFSGEQCVEHRIIPIDAYFETFSLNWIVGFTTPNTSNISALLYSPNGVSGGNFVSGSDSSSENKLLTHTVDLSVAETTSNGSNPILTANRNDSNENGVLDYLEDEKDLSDPDLMELTLKAFSHVPEDAGAHFRLSFNDEIRLWVDDNGNLEPVTSDVTLLDARDEHSLYVEAPNHGLLSGPIDYYVSATVVVDESSSSSSQPKARVISHGGDSVAIKFVGKFDLQVDSDNNGFISFEDEKIENDETKPGKVIVANLLDQDSDGRPGFANETSDSFATAKLNIPGGLNNSEAVIKFDYSAADPELVTRDATTGDYQVGSNNHLRLWTKSGTTSRDTDSVDEGGDFIEAGQEYTLDKFFGANGRSRDFFVEGVNASDLGEVTISVSLDPDGPNGEEGYRFTDQVRLSVADIKLVYTDVSGITGEADVDRIDPQVDVDGVTADWQQGVEDGSLLLASVVTSKWVKGLIDEGETQQVTFGQLDQGGTAFRSVLPKNGAYVSLSSSGFFSDSQFSSADEALDEINIPKIGEDFQGSDHYVLDARFYRPPLEFNDQLPGEDSKHRKLPLQVSLSGLLSGRGGRPAEVVLAKPAVVTVHGINSDPSTWETFFDEYDKPDSGFHARHFSVDHSGVDENRPQDGVTYGNGQFSSVYQLIPNQIEFAVQGFRNGQITLENDQQVTLFSRANYDDRKLRVASQKVDIVAHSYGGLMSRWYIERAADSGSDEEFDGSLFENRRDVKRLVTLGTPHKGSPFANVVVESYKKGLINQSLAYGLGEVGIQPRIGFLLQELDSLGQVYSARHVGGGLKDEAWYSYQAISINSEILNILNTNPFHDDVAYGAVAGTDINVLGIDLGIDTGDLYRRFSAVSQVDSNVFDRPLWPWLKIFEPGDDDTDAVVPVWSAELGDSTNNNVKVEADHNSLTSSLDALGFARNWLDGLNSGGTSKQPLLLGSVLRGNYSADVPVSYRNAYVGSKFENGVSFGAGLNRDAIVKVEVDWDPNDAAYGVYSIVAPGGLGPDNRLSIHTSQNGAGAQFNRLTGMIQWKHRNSLRLKLVSDEAVNDNVLHDLGVLAEADLNIDPTLTVGIQDDDWVPFKVDKGLFGRRQDQVLTGPNGVSGSDTENHYLAYHLSVEGDTTEAPAVSGHTRIRLPEYTLAAPVRGTGFSLAISGAITAQNAAGGMQVVNYKVRDEDLGAFAFDEIFLAGSYEITHTGQVWDGLLVPFTFTIDGLFEDGNGHIAGPLDSSDEESAQIYVEIEDDGAGASSQASETVDVS